MFNNPSFQTLFIGLAVNFIWKTFLSSIKREGERCELEINRGAWWGGVSSRSIDVLIISTLVLLYCSVLMEARGRGNCTVLQCGGRGNCTVPKCGGKGVLYRSVKGRGYCTCWACWTSCLRRRRGRGPSSPWRLRGSRPRTGPTTQPHQQP